MLNSVMSIFRTKSIFVLIVTAFIYIPSVLPASSLRISVGTASRLSGSEAEADYTTSHLLIDEVSGDRIPITIFFDPQVPEVQTADVFTNLNRRDRAILISP